jgi:hypothetical protein
MLPQSDYIKYEDLLKYNVCSLVDRYHCFGVTCYFHLQCSRQLYGILLTTENPYQTPWGIFILVKLRDFHLVKKRFLLWNRNTYHREPDESSSRPHGLTPYFSTIYYKSINNNDDVICNILRYIFYLQFSIYIVPLGENKLWSNHWMSPIIFFIGVHSSHSYSFQLI